MAIKKSKANYFTKETEEYIVKYNESEDNTYRNSIFTEHIYYPFYKLAENIIHTFKFYYTDVDKIEDLKHEIVSMLLEEKIMKFDPTNGAKAYSYFGTIVKRWLINYNNKNYKKLKQIGSFSKSIKKVSREFKKSLNEIAEEGDLKDVKDSISEIKNIKKDLDPTQDIKKDFETIKDTSKVFEKEINDLSSNDQEKN